MKVTVRRLFTSVLVWTGESGSEGVVVDAKTGQVLDIAKSEILYASKSTIQTVKIRPEEITVFI